MDYKITFQIQGYGQSNESPGVEVKNVDRVVWHNSESANEDQDDGGKYRYNTSLVWISFYDNDSNILASFREQDVRYFQAV